MKLYHFTTKKRWETIQDQGRLYFGSPVTDLDRKANESVNMSPDARYISFAEHDSFDNGYAYNKNQRESGPKLEYVIGIDIKDLEKYGKLLGPIDYLGQMDKEYINSQWNYWNTGNNSFFNWLKSNHVFKSDRSISPEAKKKLNEFEFRLFSSKNFIDLSKCNVTVASKEEGEFKPDWKDYPSSYIDIPDSAVKNIAEVVAILLLANANVTRIGATEAEVDNYNAQIDRLNKELEAYRKSIDQEKQEYALNHDPAKKYRKDIKALMSKYPNFLKWFENGNDEPNYSQIVVLRDVIRKYVEPSNLKKINDEIDRIIKRYENNNKKLKKELEDINAKKDKTDLLKQIEDLNKNKEVNYDSDEAKKIIADHIGKYVSKDTLKDITSQAIILLGRFNDSDGKSILSSKEFNRSYKFLTGSEGKLHNKELLLALEDWIQEDYREYGTDYGNYGKLRSRKLSMLESKNIISGALKAAYGSLTDFLVRKNIIRENNSGTPVALTSVISSESREKLADVYWKLQEEFGDMVKFNQSFIVIKCNTDREASEIYAELFKRYYNIYNVTLDRGSRVLIRPFRHPDNSDKYDLTGGYRTDAENQRVYESVDPNDVQEFDWSKNLAGLIQYMEKNGVKLQPLPDIVLNKEEQAPGLLAKTAEYDPVDKVITLYTKGRGIKDIVRSASHELVHHSQNLQGKINRVETDKISDGDTDLNELEREAYEKGNMLFRGYTETLRKG